MRLHVYLSPQQRIKFVELCNSRGWKMSTVLQKVIEIMITGQFDPFEIKEAKDARE